MLERCVVRDITVNTNKDLVQSRELWKRGQKECASRVDRIREHDANARAAVRGK